MLNQPINHPWLELNFCDHSCAIPKWPPTKAITATSKQPLYIKSQPRILRSPKASTRLSCHKPLPTSHRSISLYLANWLKHES